MMVTHRCGSDVPLLSKTLAPNPAPPAVLPNHQSDYDDINASVHGGLTFSAKGYDWGIPDAWWVGFDCAHHMDLVPSLAQFGLGGTYRTVEFVTGEVEALAAQAAAAPTPAMKEVGR